MQFTLSCLIMHDADHDNDVDDDDNVDDDYRICSNWRLGRLFYFLSRDGGR